MKVLFATTSTNNVNTVIGSLDSLGEHNILIFQYDAKWNTLCAALVQQNPQIQQSLQAGAWPPPEQREDIRRRVSREQELIDTVRDERPDLVIYISAWEGLFVPSNETLAALRKFAPVVHMCFDGADPPWWPQMRKFEEDGCFDFTINIDGSHVWPGGKGWRTPEEYPGWHIEGLTLLTPLDPRMFRGVDLPFERRPFQIVYAGNAGGWTRSHLFNQLAKRVLSFHARPRDDHPHSYRSFCDFLKHSRLVVSVPWTGSEATCHVKGRVLEAGYAGAALLEWENPATRAWFDPNADYFEYRDIEELIDEAHRLTSRGTLASVKRRAENLRKRVMGEHSPEKFWGAVFKKLKE